jgi:hypothetical protein
MTRAVTIENITRQCQITQLRCPGCGAHLDIALPVPLPEWLAASQSFIERHNLCSRANIGGDTNVSLRTP